MTAQSQLEETRAEVKEVKQALKDGTPYLGMKGDQLSEYFLKLNAKENILLAGQIQHSQPPAATIDASAQQAAAAPRAAPAAAPAAPAPAVAANGYAAPKAAEPVAPAELAGPAPAFDAKSLPSVVNHLHVCEGNPKECAKAIRALRAFGPRTVTVNVDDRLLPQIVRLLQLHRNDDAVVLGCVHILGNMADDPAAALGPLSQEPILAAILNSTTRKPEVKKIVDTALEALARIVAAGTTDAGSAAGGARAQLTKVCVAALTCSDAPAGMYVARLCHTLTVQEDPIIDPQKIARALISAVDQAKTGAEAAGCWLELAKSLATCNQGEDAATALSQQRQLFDQGVIEKALQLMELFRQDANVQVVGMTSLSVLIGVVMDALGAFAKAGGLQHIEQALRTHPDSTDVQAKGLRSLGSGLGWPEDMQEKAGFKWRIVVELALSALSAHFDNAVLASSALSQLAKITARLPKDLQEKELCPSVEIMEKAVAANPETVEVQKPAAELLGALQVYKWTKEGIADAQRLNYSEYLEYPKVDDTVTAIQLTKLADKKVTVDKLISKAQISRPGV